MAEFLKELGKHFLNVALAIIVSLVFQPFVKGHLDVAYIVAAGIGYVSAVFLSAILFSIGERKEKEEDE